MARVLRVGRSWAFGKGISWLGRVLFIVGLVTGWVLPHISRLPPLLAVISPLADMMRASASANGSGLMVFLGADVTALAVIIAILIGYNVAALQIAAQTVSVGLTRAVLFSLVGFVVGWIISTATVLVYLMNPPVYEGQYWQVAVWFAAISLLVLAYMWELPLRLTGTYAAKWSFKNLRHTSLSDWQVADGFAVLQAGIAAATRRVDIATVRTMDILLGDFLSSVCDRGAENQPGFNRDRYWVLYNLLSGCAQGSDTAPTTVSYTLGFVAAGTLLQAVAIGHPVSDPRTNVFGGLSENVNSPPNNIISLWAGVRYGLCRHGARRDPFLVRYWQTHARWRTKEDRRFKHVAEGLVLLYQDCWRRLNITLTSGEANEQAVILLTELYRYIAEYLAPVAIRRRSPLQWIARVRPYALLPLALLDTVHPDALQLWPVQETAHRAAITNEYNTQRTRITNLLATVHITPPPP